VSVEISLVPYGHLTGVVPLILPYLSKSEDWSDGRSSVDDIIGFLYNRQMYLFIVFETDTNEVLGYTIGQIKQYPQKKMLVMQYSAGKVGVMEEAEEKMHALVERFAKLNDCFGIRFVGRRGWMKTMLSHGYNADTIMYEKLFNGETP
jgi:hypothetical protein